MPELPEMEVYKKLLAFTVVGKRIDYAEINREKTINIPVTQFQLQVTGTTIQSIERRAKHLVFHLDSGYVLLLHLMLGGWIYFGSDQDKPTHSAQVILSLASHKLFFCGLRLGYLHLLSPDELQARFTKLGPEPLSATFDEHTLNQVINKKRGRLKTTLVDQSVIAGIGSCYSDEICFTAGLLPTRNIQDLDDRQVHNLYRSIPTVLQEAISVGGYMEYPYMKNDSVTGLYNHHRKVYDRGEEPCLRCGTPIIATKLSGRKMFYCSVCQH